MFTVASGAGLGALALLAIADLAGMFRGDGLAPAVVMRSAMVALALVVVGLVSSVFHLGNPRNAWKSLARIRTSWLSREAVASIALLGCAATWIAAQAMVAPFAVRALLAIGVVGLSAVTLYCTAMIYASLKPIRQWHTRRVPIAYVVLGLFSGAMLVVAILRAYGEASWSFAIVAGALLVIAAAVKLDYYAYIASDVRKLTIEAAIGVAQGVRPPGSDPSRMRARLFDVGHSRGTFLTHEFGYTLQPAQRTLLRAIVWGAGFLVPALWLAAGLQESMAAMLAFVVCLVGLGAERWLFFADARHTVRLYHGDRTT